MENEENIKIVFERDLQKGNEIKQKIKEKLNEAIEKQEENVPTPNLDGEDYIIIHPSVDFKDRAYFGVWLPSKENGNDIFCLITSDRKIIVCQKQILEKEKIKLSHFPIKFKKRRFELKAIKDFINNSVNVNKKDLFAEIKRVLDTYIDFPHTDFLTIWIIGTYLFPLFKAYPYVFITGIKQSGKTKLLYATSLLSFNSIFSVSASISSIFRLIQNGRCSIFIDETEKLSNPERALEFRSILLQGYKAGAEVQRVERNRRDKHVVEFFDVYSPKMLANISGLEDVLEDRCIRFVMRRTLKKEIGDSEINESDPIWQNLRDKLYIFALENWKEVKETYETLRNEANIRSREWEIWHPILAIAKFIDDALYRKMVELAETKNKEKIVENVTETGEYILAEVLNEIVKEDDYYKISRIREEMAKKYETEQKWLTNKWIGNALRRLGFTEKRRVGTGVEVKLTVNEVKELIDRLCILSFASTPSSPNSLNSLNLKENSEYSELSELSAHANNKEHDKERNELSELSELSAHANYNKEDRLFLRLPTSHFGICSYCGRETEISWVDSQGNFLCEGCRWEASKR
ncbi:MAG: hypothetical protein QXS37_06230 [Candidatus Aenigmatarchaeota archaeon]